MQLAVRYHAQFVMLVLEVCSCPLASCAQGPQAEASWPPDHALAEGGQGRSVQGFNGHMGGASQLPAGCTHTVGAWKERQAGRLQAAHTAQPHPGHSAAGLKQLAPSGGVGVGFFSGALLLQPAAAGTAQLVAVCCWAQVQVHLTAAPACGRTACFGNRVMRAGVVCASVCTVRHVLCCALGALCQGFVWVMAVLAGPNLWPALCRRLVGNAGECGVLQCCRQSTDCWRLLKCSCRVCNLLKYVLSCALGGWAGNSVCFMLHCGHPQSCEACSVGCFSSSCCP